MALAYRFRGHLGRPSSALQTALARMAAMSAATVSIAAAVPAAAQPADNARSADTVQRPGDALRVARLTLTEANTIVEKALEHAREQGFAPLTVVVLDDAGHVKAAQREDGASMFRFDVAVGKAYASVAMGASSRVLADRAKENPNFFITLAATADGKFLPQPGGVLIRNAAGEILGAAGASGAAGTEDEAAVAWGIEQAGLVPDLPNR